MLFQSTRYRGTAFLGLKGPKGKPVVPTTTKGGPWLPAAGESNSAVARFCRGITGHTPIGEYRACFHLPGITVFFFFFLSQQFIMRGTIAVRGRMYKQIQ